jgi:DNA gyrase subunit A
MTDLNRAPELLLEEEMKESYLTYAMSVLIDRALPDIRDGFKPVHRRIMYSMRDLNLTATAKYQKSAKIVGHCLGNYHPHGDTSVYDAMVRMAQDFSLRYPLVDGQGNFGSVDGDPAAAYRYTEARMSRLGDMLLEDIQYETVTFKDNYNSESEEPTVLPAKLPNLLVNGSSGIAVGMATNIPPHNLTEVCNGIIHLIDHPACTVGDLMQFVKAPDFPTGGQVCGTAGLREAYETGRGKVVMRAAIERATIEGRDAFVVTSIPYGLKTQTIKESIQQAFEAEQVTGLHSVSGGDQKEGLRIEIALKRGEDPDVVLNQLWRHTHLQYTFAINMIALDGGRPRTVSLKRMMLAYVEHRKDVIVRRTRFLLARDEARLHIVAGLLKAIDIIDRIIALIRSAPTGDVARQGLIESLGFSERQAQAILEMQLRRLTGLERDKLQSEHDALTAAITDYRDILARDARQYAIIKADLVELAERYGDERRTTIGAWSGDLSMEDLIEDEPCVVTITKSGYIKRLPVDTFRLQRRGGRGVSGGALKGDEDFISQVFTATNHQYLLVFTSLGRVHWLKVYQIPEAARAARGRALANVLALEADEHITTTIPVREFRDDQFLLMATVLGTVKKTALSAYGNPRAGGIKAIKLADGDHLVDVVITGGNDEVIIATDDGQACRFNESDCRPMGRDTSGVNGMDLDPNAKVVSLIRLEAGVEVLTICAKGFGKRTPFDEYRLTRRGGKGVINIETSERNGPVVASIAVRPGDELMIMTRQGQAVRTKTDDIRTTGRAAQGVTIIRLDEGDTVTGVAQCPREDAVIPPGEPGEPTPPAEPTVN